jgi:quercetin dioxygenase-like cupin family protein
VAEIEVVADHPFKIPLQGVPVDTALKPSEGWGDDDSDMAVQWIVTDETVGAEHHVVGLTVFKPGARHHPHRHPNAEEAQYLIQGQGLARVGDKDIEQRAGDTVFVPRNEWHGFEATGEGDTIMIWTYGGAASLEQAGYVRQDGEGDGA